MDIENEDLLAMSKKELFVEIAKSLRRIEGKLGKEVAARSNVNKISSNDKYEEEEEKEEEDYAICEGKKISSKDWKEAQNLPTGERMTKFLLGKVFTKNELAISNYRGGGTDRREALEDKRVGGVQAAVLTIFPDFSQTQFGLAVNNKCKQARLRLDSKKGESEKKGEHDEKESSTVVRKKNGRDDNEERSGTGKDDESEVNMEADNEGTRNNNVGKEEEKVKRKRKVDERQKGVSKRKNIENSEPKAERNLRRQPRRKK